MVGTRRNSQALSTTKRSKSAGAVSRPPALPTRTTQQEPRGRTSKNAGSSAPPTTKVKQVSRWFDRYEELKVYAEEHGDCLVPPSRCILGTWVSNQRQQYKLRLAGKPSLITHERIQLLNKLPGFQWEVIRGKRRQQPPQTKKPLPVSTDTEEEEEEWSVPGTTITSPSHPTRSPSSVTTSKKQDVEKTSSIVKLKQKASPVVTPQRKKRRHEFLQDEEEGDGVLLRTKVPKSPKTNVSVVCETNAKQRQQGDSISQSGALCSGTDDVASAQQAVPTQEETPLSSSSSAVPIVVHKNQDSISVNKDSQDEDHEEYEYDDNVAFRVADYVVAPPSPSSLGQQQQQQYQHRLSRTKRKSTTCFVPPQSPQCWPPPSAEMTTTTAAFSPTIAVAEAADCWTHHDDHNSEMGEEAESLSSEQEDEDRNETKACYYF